MSKIFLVTTTPTCSNQKIKIRSLHPCIQNFSISERTRRSVNTVSFTCDIKTAGLRTSCLTITQSFPSSTHSFNHSQLLMNSLRCAGHWMSLLTWAIHSLLASLSTLACVVYLNNLLTSFYFMTNDDGPWRSLLKAKPGFAGSRPRLEKETFLPWAKGLLEARPANSQ